MMASPGRVSGLAAPPAAMTTYCLPLIVKTLGVAYPPAGNWYSHRIRPVYLSNARNFSSTVAPMKTRLPAVTTAPPMLSEPVLRMPSAASAGYSPSGTFHSRRPVARSRALSVPHGGLMAGYPRSSTKNGAMLAYCGVVVDHAHGPMPPDQVGTPVLRSVRGAAGAADGSLCTYAMTSFISASDSRENDGIVPRPLVSTSRIATRLSLT